MAVLIDFLGVYDQSVIKPKTFIRDMFFAKHETHEYPKWEIEYRKGRQLVAPVRGKVFDRRSTAPLRRHERKYVPSYRRRLFRS